MPECDDITDKEILEMWCLDLSDALQSAALRIMDATTLDEAREIINDASLKAINFIEWRNKQWWL